MLDLIQLALQNHGFRFQRIDGSTSLENRKKAFNKFNDDPTYTIMLASIGSAGEGWVDRLPIHSVLLKLTSHNCGRVDLTVANHVHLIEPQWNPMVEAQAIDRVHRIGQEREVVITRYIMRNSVEKVHWSKARSATVKILILSSISKGFKKENYSLLASL